MSEKKMTGIVTSGRLEALGIDLKDAEKRKKTAEADITRIKGEIATLAQKYTLPIQESKSEYFNLPGGDAIRVTRKAAPTPRLLTESLWEEIVARVDNDLNAAREIFMNIIILPKNCDLHLDRWREYVEDEVLLNSMLFNAMEPEREPPKPEVHLGPTKKV